MIFIADRSRIASLERDKTYLRGERKVAWMKPYPDLSDNALDILERRYLLRIEQGNAIETPKMMFERNSMNVSSANDLYGDGQDTRTEAFAQRLECKGITVYMEGSKPGQVLTLVVV
jgi:ribonucleotide reductase alpha subunit